MIKFRTTTSQALLLVYNIADTIRINYSSFRIYEILESWPVLRTGKYNTFVALL